LSKSKLKIN